MCNTYTYYVPTPTKGTTSSRPPDVWFPPPYATPELKKSWLSFVEKWPLMNPNEIAFVLVTYLVFVLRVGPILMEGRAPVQMNRFLVIFNACKVVNSGVLTYEYYSYMMNKGLFPRICEHDENTQYIISYLYWKYLTTKIIDLLDTVFFILRKKSDHVTFLHVYHHAFMVTVTWACLEHDPSDHWAFMAFTNSSVHATMYLYYGISAMGPRYAKYLWWKRYLTLMQMTQFVLIMLHIIVQTYTSQCPIKAVTYWIGVLNISLFICLFADFYNNHYKAREARAKGTANSVPGFACFKQATD